MVLTQDLTITGLLSIVGFAGCGNNSELDLNGKTLFINGFAVSGGTSSRINLNGGTLTFSGTASYIHARDGGNIPIATWQDGSTCSITGITTNGVGNTNQNFSNFHWNCPSQTGGIDLVGNGNTMTVRNDFINFSTGSARLNHSNNNPTFLNTNNFILNGGNFCGNSGGAVLNVSGNFGILSSSTLTGNNGGNLNISFVGANTNITITSPIVSPDQTNFILAKSIVGARLTMFSNLSFPQEFQIQNGIIDLNGFSFSTTNRFPAPNIIYNSGFVSINPNSNLTYRTSGTGGTITYTLLGVNGVFNLLTIDNNNDDETRVFNGNSTVLGALNVPNGSFGNFLINGSNSIFVNTILNLTAFIRSTSSSTSNFVFGSSAIYVHDLNGNAIPTSTWLDGSICSITGLTTSSFTAGTAGISFSNFIWNCPSQATLRHLRIANNQLFEVRDKFIIQNTNNSIVRVPAFSNEFQRVLLNNVSILGGTFYTLHESPNSGANTLLTITGNLYVAPSAIFQKTASSATVGNFSIIFSGGNSELGILGTFSGVGFNAFDNISLSKNSINNGLILLSNVTIPSSFTFGLGKIFTNSFNLYSNSLLSASSSTGWVNGN